MDKASYKENLNMLKEMILDEQKLVTYVSISKEMCLHVNESKSLLIQIVEDLRKNNDTDKQLSVNYIISGLLEGNKAYTIVCNESELEAQKKKFRTSFYQHIYSVSLGAPEVDNVSLMAVNKFEDFPLCTGLIRSDLCVKRSSDEIGSLKTNSQEIGAKIQKPNNSVQAKVKEEINKHGNNGATEKKQVVKLQETKSEPIIKTENKSPNKDSTNKSNNKASKSQKGIAGFFNKPATANKTLMNGKNLNISKSSINKDKSETKEVEVKAEKMNVDEEITKKEDKGKKNANHTETNGNKSLNQIKKNSKVDKKRKRVLHVSDSESDDEKNDPFVEEAVADHESEDEIPPTPLVNTVKITSGIINPKKRRKIVDKTYTDEDGYILTKKEEVYESCSENEEEVHVKENIQQTNKIKNNVSPTDKKNGKIVKKKTASPQKGKQVTLMNFFKKV